MNILTKALLAIIAISTVAFSAGYDQINSLKIGDCKIDLSIKVISPDKDDGQIRYKYTKENCPKATKIQLVNVEGGYLYKKKRKNIFFRATNNFDNPNFIFSVSVKNSDGFTETGFIYMTVDIGEELDLCELLGNCTNSAQVNIVITEQFSDENRARIDIIVDKDETVDYIEINNMVFDGDLIVENDDNEVVNFPEIINNGDQWELEATTFGEKKLISITYTVYFKNPGDQEEKEPVTVQKTLDAKLGTYSD